MNECFIENVFITNNITFYYCWCIVQCRRECIASLLVNSTVDLKTNIAYFCAPHNNTNCSINFPWVICMYPKVPYTHRISIAQRFSHICRLLGKGTIKPCWIQVAKHLADTRFHANCWRWANWSRESKNATKIAARQYEYKCKICVSGGVTPDSIRFDSIRYDSIRPDDVVSALTL